MIIKKSQCIRNLSLFLILTIISNICLVSAQQANPILDSIYSKTLQEQRDIRIVLPKGYNLQNKYDVIYVLDGETMTDAFTKLHDITSDWQEMPRCIIVGVENKIIDSVSQRDRDLLPTNMSMSPMSGKADNYINFIKEDVMSLINKTYATSGRNMLFGHSHAGTFTMYTLLKAPTLFNAYIAADPSLWWDNGYVTKMYKKALTDDASRLEAKLYIAGLEGEMYRRMGIEALEVVFKENYPQNLKWKIKTYENETHITVILKTVYDGLKFVYQDFKK
ncbi:alpha/beta hydrolase-fold protein [Flavobacteriaceae bacterium MHTCC 0001]